MIYTS
jgi:hypothetical protein